MNKQMIYDFLKSKNISFEVTHHAAVFNMDYLTKTDIPHSEAVAKNLFLRDDKKRNYYLVTIKGNKKIDLKKFSEENHLRKLSFASENDLLNIMGITPGSVSPFGLLNDTDLKVQFFLDEDFMSDDNIIGIHPNENTASIYIKVEDLICIIKEHGNQVKIIKI